MQITPKGDVQAGRALVCTGCLHHGYLNNTYSVTGVSPSYYGEIGEDRYEVPVFYHFSGWYMAYGESIVNINSGSYTCYSEGNLITQSTYIYREWSGSRYTPCNIAISYRFGNGETGTYHFISDGSARYETYYASQLRKQVSYRVPGWINE